MMVLFHINFNPRSREGSDSPGMFTFDGKSIFQSTLPRRERLNAVENKTAAQKFQSTLPRRERPGLYTSKSKFVYFNPRSREGSDSVAVFILLPSNVFQSTLPRRERPSAIRHLLRCFIFQSTLPRRERQRKVAPFMAKID